MPVERNSPSSEPTESIAEAIQNDMALQFAIYGGSLFFAIQIALAKVAPGFAGYRLYAFFLMALIGLTAGCAGWACGIVLSPIGSQAGGAQKILAGFAVFWTGVIAGHLQQISNAITGWQQSITHQPFKIELLFGTGIFIFASCITFNTRFVRTSLNLANQVTTPAVPPQS